MMSEFLRRASQYFSVNDLVELFELEPEDILERFPDLVERNLGLLANEMDYDLEWELDDVED